MSAKNLEVIEPREFQLAAVLTLIVDRALVKKVGEVVEILEFMTGEVPEIHQYERFRAETVPDILVQQPLLNDLLGSEIPPDGSPPAAYDDWLGWGSVHLGSGTIALLPLRRDDHTHISPADELKLRGIPHKIIDLTHDNGELN